MKDSAFNIFVSLDKAANPPVQLEAQGKPKPRDIRLDPGTTIRWQKKDNNDSFEITSLFPTGSHEAFAAYSTGEGGQWLSSVFQPTEPPNTDTAYQYTLTVTSGAKTYNTTMKKSQGQTDDDLPVIRN